MTSSKILRSAVVVGSAALLLVGCAGGGSSGSAGSSAGSSKPTQSAAGVSSQPFNASKLLAGNASPAFPDGAKGTVVVVAEGTLVKPGLGAVLPIAYRNNTDKAIAHVDFTATARLDGKLVATGKSQGSTPAQVQAGEIGLAFIYFDDATAVPDTGTEYEYKADTLAADSSSYNTAPLVPSEVTNNGTSIVGTGTNNTGKALTGPYSVDVYCFDGNTITNEIGDYADEDGDIAAKGQTTFTVDLADNSCATFALGIGGYFK
ncbi:hypothetical protein BH10ACT6_BH10ACT6_12680 [soil metagenome]